MRGGSVLTGSDFLLVVVAVVAGNCLSRAIDWLIIEDELHWLRAELARLRGEKR